MNKNKIIIVIVTYLLTASMGMAQTDSLKGMKMTSENYAKKVYIKPLERTDKYMTTKITFAPGSYNDSHISWLGKISPDVFHAPEPTGNMLVRISEIEVYPEYLEEYLKFALMVGATSVREEPGVIAIYPMIQQRDSCQIRILEIYASQEAYRHHIDTEHFQTYKQGTLHMVKQLDLVDMYPMNPSAMSEIFRKLPPKKQ